MNAELRQQPASDKRTNNPDKEIADEPKTSALDDLAREPAGHEADKQDDQQAFARHIHIVTSAVGPIGSITGSSASVCIELIMPDRIKSAGQILRQLGSITIAADTDADARCADSNAGFARFISAALDIALARRVAI